MRLIDANKLERKEFYGNEYCFDYVDAEDIDNAPTVDAVEVVRCKDCKHSTLPSELTQRYGVPGTLTCHNRHSPCNRRNVGGDDFCSYGERKDGGAK
nr:MAG TPA: hypothetical protein [Caudoviricetes sp.]